LHVTWRRQTLPTGGLLQPHCCTQRVLHALSIGRVTERRTRDSTVSAAHFRTRRPKRASTKSCAGSRRSAERGRGLVCGAAPRLEEVWCRQLLSFTSLS